MESSKKPDKSNDDDGIEKINNHSVPVYTEGKVSGGAAISSADFAFLMKKAAQKKH